MRLFLQIHIGDWKQRSYHNPLVSYASSLAPDMMGTDIDNESESVVIDLVIKLTEQAESVFVFVSADTEAQVGSVDKMMQYLLHHESKVHQLVAFGEHSVIGNLAEIFQGRFIKINDTEEVKKRIQSFATKTA